MEPLLHGTSDLCSGHWLIGVVYHGRYVGDSKLLPILAISGMLTAAAQGPIIGLRAMQVPKEVFVGYTASGVFVLLTGVTMIHFWGLTGAAIGMASSALCFLIVVWFRFQARLKTEWVRDDTAPRQRRKDDTRVAWLLPSMARGQYWQPVLREFQGHFPNSLICTSRWEGFLPGYEGSLNVCLIPGFKEVILQKDAEGYDQMVTTVPVWPMVRTIWKFRPEVVFVSAFNMWTMCAILLKCILRYKVIVLYDGVSPHLTFQNSKMRLATRRFMAHWCAGAISNSVEGVDYLRDVLHMPAETLLHHPYQVPDTEVIQAVQAALPLLHIQRPTFLFVGSLIERKGWRYLLQAAGLLQQRNHKSFSVVLAGPGEQKVIREQIEALCLQDKVHVVGAIAYQELGSYFRATDVFVFPTLEDIWGVVPLEAMACGMPVLCSKRAGAKEMVENGRNGFLFDPVNPIELADCMEKFLLDPELITEFGKNSERKMLGYTPLTAANGLVNIVEAAMSGDSV